MQVRLLGPLDIDCGGVPRSIGRAMQRRVLAMLALRANKAVAADSIIDAVWRTGQPPGAASLHPYISRLRSLLSPYATITRLPEGYRLELTGDQLDIWCFEHLLGAGRASLADGNAKAAAATLHDALRLWRGEPLFELDHLDAALIERRRLNELRLTAEEDLLEAHLALGANDEVVSRAPPLLAAEPLRERIWGHWMLALYRTGRQAEALRVAADARRTLCDEVGLEPTPLLQSLERDILDRAPSLDLPTSTGAVVTTRRDVPVWTPPTRNAVPATRYANAAGVHLAYQVIGEGPNDLLYVPSYVSHLDAVWELPRYADFLLQLASDCRLILFDKRGMGLSDRVQHANFDERASDVLAVLDAVGSQRTVLFGCSEGGAFCAATAAQHPDRVSGLVLFGSTCSVADDSFVWAPTVEQYMAFIEWVSRRWGTGRSLQVLAPSVADEPEAIAWFGRMERLALSPKGLFEYQQMQLETSWHHLLEQIRVPTLVLHRRDEVLPLGAGSYLAQHIPAANLEILDGTDHLPWFGDATTVANRVREFAHHQSAVRVLSSVRE